MEYKNDCINGLLPNRAVELGYALGRNFGQNISVGYDGTQEAMVFEKIIKQGIVMSGKTVYDFYNLNMPMFRSGVRFYSSDYGIYFFTRIIESKKRVLIKIIDKTGVEVTEEEKSKIFDIAKKIVPELSDNIGNEKNIYEYKNFYLRKILNNIKSKKFSINFSLQTKSKIVSDVLGDLLDELYCRMLPEGINNLEFNAELIHDGDTILLYKSDGTALTEEQKISVMTYILLRDSDTRTFVLPEDISSAVEDAVTVMGGKVIRCSDNKAERMKKVLYYGSDEQMMMEFDGIFAAVKILDFLNRYDISFDCLADHMPNVFKSKSEIMCGKDKADEIITALKKKFRSDDSKQYVKIKADKGIALILPSGANGTIKIFSEANDMEAAEEISTLYKNKIKKLAMD